MTDRSFTSECPVCLENLFDEDGLATKDVAEIMCPHLIHSDCLSEVGKALNADGARYGHGAAGIRSGCPVCNTPVSFWTMSKDAAYFKAFWIERIENVLKELGQVQHTERKEPIAGKLVREKLNEDDSLTAAQKAVIEPPSANRDMIGADSGFTKALKSAGSVDYSVDRVIFSFRLTTRGIWQYDAEQDDLWLWEWGPQHPRLGRCSHCGDQPLNLSVCSGCKDSCDAHSYCNRECQKAGWRKHKKNCRTFQIMKQGGTREELLQRLRELH